MGIGRREFLRLFGGALAAIAARTDAAAAVLDDLYLNRKHGIGFRKPHGWQFQDLRDVGKSQAGTLLDWEDFDSAAFAEYILSDETHAPFVVAIDERSARYLPGARSPDADHVAPVLFVAFEGTWERDGPNPAAPFSLEAYVARDLEHFAEGYSGFTLIQPPTPTRVSECQAMEYISMFRAAHRDIPYTIPTRERVLYVHQNPAIYGVRMFDFPELDPPLCFEFDDFIRTLQII